MQAKDHMLACLSETRRQGQIVCSPCGIVACSADGVLHHQTAAHAARLVWLKSGPTLARSGAAQQQTPTTPRYNYGAGSQRRLQQATRLLHQPAGHAQTPGHQPASPLTPQAAVMSWPFRSFAAQLPGSPSRMLRSAATPPTSISPSRSFDAPRPPAAAKHSSLRSSLSEPHFAAAAAGGFLAEAWAQQPASAQPETGMKPVNTQPLLWGVSAEQALAGSGVAQSLCKLSSAVPTGAMAQTAPQSHGASHHSPALLPSPVRGPSAAAYPLPQAAAAQNTFLSHVQQLGLRQRLQQVQSLTLEPQQQMQAALGAAQPPEHYLLQLEQQRQLTSSLQYGSPSACPPAAFGGAAAGYSMISGSLLYETDTAPNGPSSGC